MRRNNRIWLIIACVVALSILTSCTVPMSESRFGKPQYGLMDVSSIVNPPGSLEELVLLYKDEFASLNEEERTAITQTWASNSFGVKDSDEMLGVYGEYLSKDASAVLFIWNAQCCADYVRENFDGDQHYISDVEVSLHRCIMDFVALWSKGLPQEDFENALSENLTELRRALIAVVGSNEDYMAPISDLMKEYGSAQGAKDAEAFFRLIDD